jgi:hypothetical protein
MIARPMLAMSIEASKALSVTNRDVSNRRLTVKSITNNEVLRIAPGPGASAECAHVSELML